MGNIFFLKYKETQRTTWKIIINQLNSFIHRNSDGLISMIERVNFVKSFIMPRTIYLAKILDSLEHLDTGKRNNGGRTGNAHIPEILPGHWRNYVWWGRFFPGEESPAGIDSRL